MATPDAAAQPPEETRPDGARRARPSRLADGILVAVLAASVGGTVGSVALGGVIHGLELAVPLGVTSLLVFLLTLALLDARSRLREARADAARARREVASAGLRNTAHLLVLHELGALASSEQGQRAPRKRVIDLAALGRGVAGNFSASGAGRRLELIGFEVAVAANVDPHQIQTVLYALLSSAFERTDPVTGSIRLALSVVGDELSLELADNGRDPGPEPGLDPTVTSRGGPGLGLAVCREIIGAHQGRLEVQSTSDGLEVRVHLPRGDASTAPAPFLDESSEVLDFLHRVATPTPDSS